MTKARAIAASYVGVVVFSGFLFLGAWNLLYWQGLLYLAVALAGATINHLVMPKGSTLTEERAARAHEGLPWDKKILGLSFLTSLVTFVVAGMDSGRFGWTGPVPPGLTAAGVVVLLAGQVTFAVAKRENAFFSSTVRIQSEKGHKVCDTGPYRFVRHPGYLGLLVSNLGFPLVLNSWYSWIPTAVGLGLLVTRTALEDAYLRENLEGYREYCTATRWKLVPLVF